MLYFIILLLDTLPCKYSLPGEVTVLIFPTHVFTRYFLDVSDMFDRYTFGKPVIGKLTVNMTVNGVGYYRQEMGHPVIKTMEVGLFSSLVNRYPDSCACVYQ